MQKELEKASIEGEKIMAKKTKAKADLEPYYKEIEDVKKATARELSLGQRSDAITKEQKAEALDTEKITIQNISNEYTSQLNTLKDIEKQEQANLAKQEQIKASIANTEKQLGGTNLDFKKMGQGMQGLIKKAVRYGLAIFGVRSIYMGLRQAMSTISQYDTEMADKIDGIKLSLAAGLYPIIKWIVDLVQQLVTYLDYILHAWFGINILADANALKMKKGAGSAKEMKKQLQGFDEMNVVSDTSSSSTNGGATLPSMANGKVPDWVDWIAKNGNLIKSILLGIATALGAVALGVEGVKATGIGLAIGGIALTISSILSYINDPSWSNFGDTIIGIGATIAGVALIFSAWPVAIAGAIVAVVGIIAKFWEQINQFLDNLKSNIFNVGENIKSTLVEWFGIMGNLFAVFTDTIVGVLTSAISIVQDAFNGLFKGIKGIIDGIIQICKGDLKGGLTTIFKGIGNMIIGVLNVIIDALNLITSPIRALIVAVGAITGQKWTMENIKIPNINYLKTGGIINMPGKGVPISATTRGGEAGREGVIPLTDEQAMEELGSSIGRHVVINVSLTNEMDGRVLSRQVKSIIQDEDFATNR